MNHRAWRFILRKSSLVGLVLIAIYVTVALTAPILSPPDPEALDPAFKIVAASNNNRPIPPGGDLPLGGIPVGHNRYMDIYHSLVWGARSALEFGLIVVVVSAIFGILVGAISAHTGGWVDNTLMRFTDAFLAFPMIAGVVFFQQLYLILITPEKMFSPMFTELPPPTGILAWFRNIDPLLIALILLSWMAYARITNSVVLQVKQMAFVEAARSLGASSWRQIFRHLIPNSVTPAVVLAARDIGALVLFQATLAFIGLSESSPWGVILSEGRRWIIGVGGNMFIYWWVFFPATLAIILFGIGWNLIGDNINDWLNPHRD
jgi:peptide/nickel transport system permease protein